VANDQSWVDIFAGWKLFWMEVGGNTRIEGKGYVEKGIKCMEGMMEKYFVEKKILINFCQTLIFK